MTRSSTCFILTALVMLALILAPAHAQQTGVPSDNEVRARLGFIQTALDSGQGRARTWQYGWLGGYSAATAVQWGLAIANAKDIKPIDDSLTDSVKSDRMFAQDMLVGGATTALGVVGFLIDPFIPASAPGRLRSLPESTPQERRTKLREAEDLLRQCARREEAGRGLMTHLLNLGVNAAAGVVTAAAFKRPWTDGLINFGIGEAVSLLTIFTQPRRAVRDWKNYEVTCLGQNGEPLPAPAETDWSLGLFPGGFRLAVSW